MDDYRFIKYLGKGAYGQADLYERKSDKVKFVIKTIDPSLLDDKDRADAYREVEVLKDLTHVHIVKYEASFKVDGKICIVMEYCELGDLQTRVLMGEPLSEQEIWEWFVQICKALEYMHGSRVIHRDLTPTNIFISKDQTLRVGDFGLARPYSGSVYLTRSKESIGAVEFNAPEMLDDMKFTDKCDVWALGCVLYFMIMRQPPFHGNGLAATIRKITVAKYPAIPDTVCEGLRDTVSWLLTSDPKERPNIRQVLDSDRLRAAVEPTQRLRSIFNVTWDKDMLRDNEGQRYRWNHYVNERDNKARYESFALYVTDVLYKKMLEMGLMKLPVPLGPRVDPDFENPGTVIFATENWKTCKRLLILIHGSNKVRAGQWTRQGMIYSSSVESGTQIPYIRKAMQCGYGVLVLNTNDNRPRIEGCESAESHGIYVWENYVMETAATQIAVKSHSDGGAVASAIYKRFEKHFQEKVYGNAFTGAQSIAIAVNGYTKKVTRSWTESNKPLGTVLTSSPLECVSAGTDKHIYTPHYAFPKVFEFIAARFNDSSPGNP